MNILLIDSPIRIDAKPSCIPYGLVTVASTLIKSGFEVEIYDINALRPTKTQILDDLKTKREGIENNVHLVRDAMYDACLYYGSMAEEKSVILERLTLKPKSYFLV